MNQTLFGCAGYTIYGLLSNDTDSAFALLEKNGLRYFEMFGDNPSDLDTDAFVRCAEIHGITICGRHTEWRELTDEKIADTIEYLKKVRCPVCVIPCLGGKWNIGHDESMECEEIWHGYTHRINEINSIMKENGIKTAYHNHDHEFRLKYSGRTVFEILYDNLDPDIIMEIDSGNCIEGGGNMAEVLKKYSDREMILHAKPYSLKNGFNTYLGAEDDENDITSYLNSHDFLYVLIESENKTLPEETNLSICTENLRNIRGISL